MCLSASTVALTDTTAWNCFKTIGFTLHRFKLSTTKAHTMWGKWCFQWLPNGTTCLQLSVSLALFTATRSMWMTSSVVFRPSSNNSNSYGEKTNANRSKRKISCLVKPQGTMETLRTWWLSSPILQRLISLSMNPLLTKKISRENMKLVPELVCWGSRGSLSV